MVKTTNMTKRLVTRFLGMPMAQTKKSINVWEELLARHEFKRILEIGTYKGNLALYLLLFCMNRPNDAEFHTYDIKNLWGGSKLKNTIEFGKCFKKWDVFEHVDEIGKLIGEEGISIVFCDGNEKSDEFNTFAPFLKVGDIIGQHDWNSEFSKEEETEETRRKYHLRELLTKECDDEGYLRFFIKDA